MMAWDAARKARWPVLTDAELLAKLKGKCVVTDSGCWELPYAPLKSKGMKHQQKGYGQFYMRGKPWRAHRAAYTLAKGPIPAGYVVAHSCDNPPCCNPDHLTACTEKENMQQAGAKKRWPRQYRDTCAQGHPRTPENMVYHGRARKKLHCRICVLIRNRMKAGWTKDEAESIPFAIEPGAVTPRRDFNFKR